MLGFRKDMKDPNKIEQQDKDKMAVITSYGRMIVGDKIRLDTDRYQHRWSGNTYHCLTELSNSKVRCKCQPCDLVRHQISLQLRNVFTWTNQFCPEVEKQKDVIGEMCEEIFSLIEKSHSHFITSQYSGIMFITFPEVTDTTQGKEQGKKERDPGCDPYSAYEPHF